MTTKSLGTLSQTPVTKLNEFLNTSTSTNQYVFDVNSASNIDFLVKEISPNHDLRVELFRDNGTTTNVVDSGDTLVRSTNFANNTDELVSMRNLSVGHYIARVSQGFNSSGVASYDVVAAAGGDRFSKVLQKNNIGDSSGFLNTNKSSIGGLDNNTRTNFVSFKLAAGKTATVSLGMSGGDADLLVAQDFNNNHKIDAGEEVGRSVLGGTFTDSVSFTNVSGSTATYYAQAAQFTAGANIGINFAVNVH